MSLAALICRSCLMETPARCEFGKVRHAEGCPTAELERARRRGDEAEVARLAPLVRAIAGVSAARPS